MRKFAEVAATILAATGLLALMPAGTAAQSATSCRDHRRWRERVHPHCVPKFYQGNLSNAYRSGGSLRQPTRDAKHSADDDNVDDNTSNGSPAATPDRCDLEKEEVARR
jgi:hypothetical protein